MAIEVLADVIAPNNLFSANVRGKNIRVNERVRTGTGEMWINIVSPLTLRQFTIGTVPLRLDQWEAVIGLHENTEGGAYGFLMEDPSDCVALVADSFLRAYTTEVVGTVGVGFGVPVHKLYKSKTAPGPGARKKYRRITRPGSIVIERTGTPVSVGIAAGNIALDATTGTVTFVADDTSAASSITPGATTQVVLASAMGHIATQRLYLTGFAGANASLVNGLSHVINSVVGTTFVLATNTSGAAITLGAGEGRRYPQASETLTWRGRFYTPVHFEADSIDWDLAIAGAAESRFFTGPNVVLDEVIEATE